VAGTERSLPLVGTATSAPQGQEAFAARVLEVLEAHGDIASEACWQEFARVIARDWLILSQDQPAMQTWGMMARCCETVLKVRRGAKQNQGEGGQEALEAFRSLMQGVLEGDDTPVP
jgi:hypothetical protein